MNTAFQFVWARWQIPGTSTLRLYFGTCLMVLLATGQINTTFADSPTSGPLYLVVMDPLAAQLSCPCVDGYAQRDYEQFAASLGEKLERQVVLKFATSLEKVLQESDCPRIDLIIGKDSVVRCDAAEIDLPITPAAQLTGKDGTTTQTGLIVVPDGDAAQSPSDLSGYRIFFGPSESDEKHSAAMELLREANVIVPDVDELEISPSCSDGAGMILELPENERGAAVISSYAAPLLEGCGTVEEGALRVVGTTKPVPFITLFLVEQSPETSLPAELNLRVMEVSRQPQHLLGLESLLGFVPLSAGYKKQTAKFDKLSVRSGHETTSKQGDSESSSTDAEDSSTGANNWPGWRGPKRDGHCQWLPKQFSPEAKIIWQQPLAHEGLGGIAATTEFVVLGDRDLSNTFDEFRCFDAATGQPKWVIRYPAMGRLDYDNAPRATPQISGHHVYLFGAFGDLHCVELSTGLIVWRKNILQEFGATTQLIWGTCSSPLLIGDMLIINPGAPEASIVALDAKSGSVLWQTPGESHAYASPIEAKLGGVTQLIAFDRESIGGFDPETGSRLWQLTPKLNGDFNVPTPTMAGDQLLLVSENNGTRLYNFSTGGKIKPKPAATYRPLAPDMSTPVVVGKRAFCLWESLYCLDLENSLEEIWTGDDEAFSEYGPIIATESRLLIAGRGGELLLVDALADEFHVLSRIKPFGEVSRGAGPSYAHPAIVGHKLYLRNANTLACLDLAE